MKPTLLNDLMANAPKFESMEALWNAAIRQSKREIGFEFGTASGKTANIMSLGFDKFVTFDWFKGLPEDWRKGFEKGAFAQAKIPQLAENVTVVMGLIEATLEGWLDEHGQKPDYFHFDLDLHDPTRYALDLLHIRGLIRGSVLVFDEFYNYPGFLAHEMRAFKEFVTEFGLSYEWIGRNVNHEQVAVRIL